MRAASRDAVLRGASWLASYLIHVPDIEQVGADGVVALRELSQASHEPVAALARHAAQEHARQVEAWLLSKPGLPHQQDGYVALDLLGNGGAIGVSMDGFAPRIDVEFAVDPVTVRDLPRLNEEDIYELLVDTYTIEKARAAQPSMWVVAPIALRDLLLYLSKRELVADPSDARFSDHAYLATHIALVLSDYGVLKLDERRLWRVSQHLRKIFEHLLASKDVELVGEIVEVMRLFGHTEETDDVVRRGTLMLLDEQHADGSWGPWIQEKDAYDAMHYTWCALSGLRERQLLSDSMFARHLRKLGVRP